MRGGRRARALLLLLGAIAFLTAGSAGLAHRSSTIQDPATPQDPASQETPAQTPAAAPQAPARETGAPETGAAASQAAPAAAPATAAAPAGPDTDVDGMPDTWEMFFGLLPNNPADAAADPDGDGLTNLQEFQTNGHPVGRFKRYFAEGSTGFFQTSFGVVNLSTTDVAHVQIAFFGESGPVGTHQLTLQPRQRQTVSANAVLPNVGPIAAIVESDAAVAADRLVQWGPSVYGSHIDSGVPAPSTSWYLPEGATGLSQLYYLLLNPNATPANVQIKYFREASTPITRNYTIAPRTRATIFVNLEALGLLVASVGAEVTSNVPVVAEHAMYFSVLRPFGAGTGGSGVPALGTHWTFAEGATGPFFDEFIALINPSASQTANVTLTYHLDSGATLTKTYPVVPQGRHTVYLNLEALIDPTLGPLASTLVWISVDSDIPIAAARAMWWEHLLLWDEGHASVGSSTAALSWVVPEGSEGGPAQDQTFILIANPSATAGQVRLTLVDDAGATAVRTLPIGGFQRLSVGVGSEFGLSTSRYSVFVESIGASPVPVVVDYARYSSPGGHHWAAGGATVAIQTTPPDQAPTVTATTPANGATGVSLNGNLSVTFSEPVNATASAFTLQCPAGTPIALTNLTASPATVFDLDPTAQLPADSDCVLTVVANQVTDVDTNDPPDTLAANHVVNFHTQTEAAPVVESTLPVPGATQIAANRTLTITFSEAVNVAGNWFQIACTASGTRNVADTVVAGGPTVFTADPAVDFTPGETCTVTVFGAQVTDQDALDPPDVMAANHVFSFTIDVAPTVTATTPANGATNVASTANLSVTFSEPVTVAGNWFQLACTVSGTRNPADTVVSGGPSVFTIDPNVNFGEGETCTMTIVAASVTDQDASDPPDAMAANHVFSFATTDPAPFVTATNPTNGGTVAMSADLNITFSEPVNVGPTWFQIVCSTSGTRNPADTVISGGPTVFTINPNTDFAEGESCTATIVGAQVTDQDADDPPDAMAANHVFTFSTDAAPSVTGTTPANGATQQAATVDLGITFSEAVNVTGNWFQIVCATSGTRNPADTVVSGGPTAFTVNPNADFAAGELCTVTVLAAQVTDQDSFDPPDAMAANHVFSFTIDEAPTVTATVPANGATQIATTANVGVTFSEPVNVAGNWFTLACTVSGTRNVADTVVSGGPTVFAVDPNVDFTQGETCTLTVVAAAVSDQDAGDPPDTMAADHVASFTIDQAPTVSSTVPTNGATDVGSNTNVSVTFSEPVNVGATWFQIACTVSGTRGVADTVVAGGPFAFSIDPNADFAAGETCTVTVTAAQITDQDAGDPPDTMVADFVFSFTIDQAPTVTSTTPLNGATVATNVDLSVTFSEPVTLNGAWIQIACTVSGTRNAGDVAVGGGPTVYTINPNADFAAGESCTTTIVGAQVTDNDANDPPDAMASNHVFTFSTDAAPSVTSTTPANGATQQVANVDLSITFNESVATAGNWFQIVCASSGTRNVSDTAVSGGPTTFTINPNVDFTQGELCTVTVLAAQVTDTDALDPPDTMAANHVFTFTIDAAPSVTTTLPANGTTNVLPNTDITVNFSESVTATTSSFTIDCGSGALPYALLPASPSNTFTLNPNADLTGASCTVTVIAAQVTDADSADPPDTMLANHVFSFTLEQAPSVLSTVPANGATGITPAQLITVNFSEPVNANVGSFTLECPAATPRAFTVGGSGTAAVTLTPTGGLPAGAICNVVVLAAGITDVDTADPPDNLPGNVPFSFSVPPIAGGDSYAAIGHVTVDSSTGVAFTVLANDLFAMPLTQVVAVSPTTANGGMISIADVGPGAGQFVYIPPVGHGGAAQADSFNYTITNPAGTGVGTVTFSVATPIWFINNGVACGACDGRQGTPFATLGAFQAVNDGVGSHPAAGDHIFVHENGTAHTGGVTLLANQTLIGQDAGAGLLTITGHTLPPGSSVPNTNAGNGVFATIGAVRLNTNTLVRGLNLTTNGATALDDPAGAITGVNVSEVRISATNAPAVTLSSATGPVTLLSVAASGSTHGISLNGTNGAFTVLGADGGDAGTDPDPGTGGTISNTTGRGAAFVNHTGAISLGGMNFTNTSTTDGTASTNCGAPAAADNASCNAAIHFTNAATSVNLNTILVDGSAQVGINASGINNLTMTNVEVRNAGTDSHESGVMLRNITGTSSITNGNFHDNEARQLHIGNAAGTGTLTIKGTTIANAFAPNGGVGLLVEAHNAGTNLTVHTGGLVAGEGLTIQNLFSNGWQAVTSSSAQLTATLRGSSLTNINGIVAQSSLNGNWTGAIEGNTFVAGPNTGAGVVSIKTDGGGSMDLDAIGNVIGQDGVANSGTACDSCGGFFINPRNPGNMNVDVIGNIIQNVDGNAIFVGQGEADTGNDTNVRITGNLIRQPGPFASLQRIAVEVRNGVTSGPPADNGCMALTLGGSVTPGSWPSQTPNAKNQILGTWNQNPATNDDVFLWQRFQTIIRLPGLAGDVATFITNNNVFDGTPVVTVLANIPANIQAGASCP